MIVDWLKNRWYQAAGFLVLIISIVFRFYDLELKPLHHDEGVNGYFLTELFTKGIYRYDPTNYHGPTLYYIALVFSKLFGLETFAIRASVAIFGVLMVLLVLSLNRYLGRIGSLTAAAFLAVTPGMVYISRYFIHETFFVFCSLVIVLCVLRFLEGNEPSTFAVLSLAIICFVCLLPSLNAIYLFHIQDESITTTLKILILAFESVIIYLILKSILDYKDGQLVYPLLIASSLALFFATKETAFITIGTMLIALLCIWVWRRIYGGMLGTKILNDDLAAIEFSWTTLKQRIRSRNNAFIIFGACFVTFAYVSAVFFSSFFTYPHGIIGAIEAYNFWARTGVKDHIGETSLYLKWLWKLEYPLVVLTFLGILIAFLKAKHKFAMFVALWAFGLFIAYSLIPYKTPWLILSFLLPMCLISGYAINEIVRSRLKVFKILGALLFIFAFAILTYNAYDLNFRRYDDDSLTYVYAHTRRPFLEMVRKINYYAEKSGKGRMAAIDIVSPEYWPLPWYLRNYEHTSFYGRIVDIRNSELIIAEKGKQDAEVFRKYRANYKIDGIYPLRPGVDLILLVRKDIADENAKSYEEAFGF